MQAIRYDAYGATPTLVEVDDPVCPDDGVVIEVRATGVCRSDWHAWRGHDPVPLPQIPGHEFAGVVVEVGPSVTGCRVGDRVTVPFVCGCGRCAWCRDGDAQICPDQSQPGFTMPGSFAERVAIGAADFNVVHLPSDLDFAAAASLGCRFATAYRAITVHGRVGVGDRHVDDPRPDDPRPDDPRPDDPRPDDPRPDDRRTGDWRTDDWVSIYGCGGVGLSAVMIASALGARVIAVDRSPAALALAQEFGAEVILNADHDPAAQIIDLTYGGAAVSLDAVGSADTATASISSLRPRGRHVQVGLLLGEDAAPAIPMGQVIAKELQILGSHGMAAGDYAGMLELVASGAVRPDRLVGKVIGLEDAGAALAAMDAPSPRHGMTVVQLPAASGRSA